MAAKPAMPASRPAPAPVRPARRVVEDDDTPEESAKPRFGRIGALWRMFTRRPYIHVLALCAMFAAVICAGAYATRDPHGLFESMMGGKGPGIKGAAITNVGRPDLPVGAASMPDDDPVKQFHKTGIGHVLFTGPSTDNCKRTLFDNRTGGHREVAEVFCGQTPDQVTEAQSGDRLESMRKGFKK
jgi:hypothetical protein